MVKWIERETNTQTAVKTQTSKLSNSYSETDIDKQATSIWTNKQRDRAIEQHVLDTYAGKQHS